MRKGKPKKRRNPKAEFIRRRNIRMVLVGLFFCASLGYMVFRIGYLKYVWGDEYERRAVMQHIIGKNSTEKETNPNRGYILDRNKQPLAISSRVYNIILDVTVLNSRTPTEKVNQKQETLTALSEVLDIPMSELETLFAKDANGDLKKPTNYHVLARRIPSSQALQLKGLYDVYLEEDTLRSYADPTFAPQTIGFIRGDSAWGLENSYNDDLRGETGRIFRTYDQDNNPDTKDIPARDGYTLITTLDAGINRIAQSIVDKTVAEFKCEYAGMLVMNPKTGEIIAMAQWPSFSQADPSNPAFFTDVSIQNNWDALSAEKQLEEMYNVWGNYHISHSFEPGSIFKPMVVAAAIEENIINPANDSFFCGGNIQVMDRLIPCWTQYSHNGQNVVEVLANSCNIGMIEINKRLGRDLFFKYRNDFGFGEKTDIDLPGEAAVSSSYVMYTLSQLNPVEMATSAMGQGFNATPIQAITAFSAVINGGYLMKPYLVSQVVDTDGAIVREYEPTVVRKVISNATSDFMRDALQAVFSPSGTGKRAAIEGYSIGGKTGTAQQGQERKDIVATFMAYLPVENPEYIALVIIDKPEDNELTSSVLVGPMMHDALWEIIQYKNIQPSDGSADMSQIRESAGARAVMNDYSGMSLTDVTHNLNNLEIDYQIAGSGTVVSHHIPAAGQTAPKDAPVYLYMDADSVSEGEMTYVPDVEGLAMIVGENYIRDAYLTPVTFIDKPEGSAANESGGDPSTYYPEENAPDGESADLGGYVIYRQYPSAGAYIQKGTEVKIKVRPAG